MKQSRLSLQITVDGNPAWAGLLSSQAANDLAEWCRKRPEADAYEGSVFEHLATNLEGWANRQVAPQIA